MQLVELLRGAAVELTGAGVTTPEVDAEWLLAHALGVPKGEMLARAFGGGQASQELVTHFASLVARRAAREPLQHITGTTMFSGMELRVGAGVFVPRPETELLVELVIQHENASNRPGNLNILDIGTGSGAIACALQREFPEATVTAFELDPHAAKWAQGNFDLFAPAVHLEVGDLTTLLPKHPAVFDLIVSNPPYIPTDAVPIDPEVRLHDPDLALYSGADGLDAIRQIARLASGSMRPGGALWLEHADGQSPAIVELLLAQGWRDVQVWKDLTDRQRFVSARVA